MRTPPKLGWNRGGVTQEHKKPAISLKRCKIGPSLLWRSPYLLCWSSITSSITFSLVFLVPCSRPSSTLLHFHATVWLVIGMIVSSVWLFIHMSVCLSIRDAVYCRWMIHSTVKVSEQVNRKCPHRNTILQLSTPYIDPAHSNASPLELYMLVPSGE